ncbi:hypothetical protein X975_26153, partial [Stegodyphus mimosarum]
MTKNEKIKVKWKEAEKKKKREKEKEKKSSLIGKGNKCQVKSLQRKVTFSPSGV